MIPPKDEMEGSNVGSQQALDPKSTQTTWKVGTLTYTKAGLFLLFFWLMWNDFFLMLMEAVKPALTGILMKRHGATNTEIALYMGTLSAVFTNWINPVVSTWSDRTRTRWGRRRPFLFLATIPAGIFLALIPFSPKAWTWLMSSPWFAAHFGGGTLNGAVLAIGICTLFFTIFNSVLMAIFSYYFWDVIPSEVLGRFNAICKIVTTIKTFIWNYWVFGMAETHLEVIYCSLAFFFVFAYLLSLYMVPEGEYPPPDKHTKGGKIFAPIRAYFVECYSSSYYLWIFVGFAAYQLGNVSNIYRLFHWIETLNLSLDAVGKVQAWPSLLIVIIGYPLGSLVDKLKPMRLMPWTLLLWGLSNVYAFYFLRGATALLIFLVMMNIFSFMNGICAGVLTVEVFPREKLGQFCSANQLFHSTVGLIATPLVGVLFDYLKDYTYVYAWSAAFQFLAAILFAKVYFNWLHAKKHAPVPHAG